MSGIDSTAPVMVSGATGYVAGWVVKRLLADTLQTPLETQMEYESAGIAVAARSDDGREGVSAFLGKRKPNYKGS